MAVVERQTRSTTKTWTVTFTRPAAIQRNSRNRAAGTMQTTKVEGTKEVNMRKMPKDVLPAIKAVWTCAPGDVFVQQDNAPSHNIAKDPDIVPAMLYFWWVHYNQVETGIHREDAGPEQEPPALEISTGSRNTQKHCSRRTVDTLQNATHATHAQQQKRAELPQDSRITRPSSSSL